MLAVTVRQRGVTLVELMVASSLSLVALAAVLTVCGATSRHARLQLQAAHLHQQVHGILYLIGRDLRRAGYWHFDAAQQSPAENPFQNGENRLRSGALPDEAADSCVLLAYDLDADGLVGVGQCRNGHCPRLADDNNVEQFGFRLRNRTVQSRYGGTGQECDSGYWQSLNDPEIEITQLHFRLRTHCISLTQADTPCSESIPRLVQRVARVDIGARIRNQPETEIHLVEWISVRNDQLLEGTP
jgi:prepilin peptidase dependent protein B